MCDRSEKRPGCRFWFRQENELPPRNAIYAMLDATMRGASSGVALARSLAAISGNSAR